MHLSTPASPAMGFVPLATSLLRGYVFSRRSHSPLRSVFRFSQPLDGFFRTKACRLISSYCHVQGSFSFRGFSLTAAVLPHRKALPPYRCCTVARRARFDFRRLAPASTCGASRFRGFAPRSTAFLGSGYSPRPKPLPSSRFRAPPGAHSPDFSPALAVLSARAVRDFELLHLAHLAMHAISFLSSLSFSVSSSRLLGRFVSAPTTLLELLSRL